MKVSETTLLALAIAIGVGTTSCKKTCERPDTPPSTEVKQNAVNPTPDPVDCPACGMG